ncbi:ADP-ribosyltransferase [Clostridium paraputrificum]|uniref:ADP-ribosyltransferase n=1 Tax=Clostridium paraputrificum TaxID=29363 RepID=UPI003D32F49B
MNNSDDWIKSLSKEEIDSLYKYQSNDIYERLNAGLRNGEIDDDLIETIKNLDSAISKGNINGEIELYRGFTKEDIIENWGRILNGKQFEFIDDGYVSTSMKPSVADNFAMLNDEDGIFAYVKVSNTNGANINAISSIDEAEILLERGLTYKITKAWEENGYKYVIMEVSK